MTDAAPTESVKRQFASAHKMLRDAVTNFPPEEWRKARHDFLVPARLAFHVVQATDFHLDGNPDAFDWDRFGINWEETPAAVLLDQPQLLAYMDEVEAKLDATLQQLAVSGLSASDYAGRFPTALDHLLYTLRHVQHHTGQINAELKRRGLNPSKWR